MIDSLISVFAFLGFILAGMLWVWGIHCLFQEGMLLEWLGDPLRTKDPKKAHIFRHGEGLFISTWYSKMLFDCPPCQSSIHGTLIFLAVMPFHWYIWPVYLICLCGANYILKEHLYEP